MSGSYLRKIVNFVNELRTHPAAARLIQHNQHIFEKVTGAKRTARQPVVLLELNAMQSAHIAYSYLTQVLAHDNQAQIKAYSQRPKRGVIQRVTFFLRRLFGSREFGVFRSFGVNEFIDISLNSAQRKRAKQLFSDVYLKLKTTRDIEDLQIAGVWIGDLVYDSFLMTYRKATIDRESSDFQRSLLESLEIYVFWDDYLNTNDVRGINVSHCVYNLAIPLRMAVKRGIPAFQVNATHVYRLGSAGVFAYNDFFYFRERFAALPEDVRERGLIEAKKRVDRRFSGEVGVDMSYSSKSAYGNVRSERLVAESAKTKILIATHCFFDSPHSYGNNLFPDFYEWLDFLGGISQETDYDWYIKTHPDYLPGTMQIIEEFIARYPKFKLLPSDASHHQIIAEGIDLTLTVYGTIGFEYAALGVPVINASLNNPHIAYDFNLHAQDVDDYRNKLLHLNDLGFEIDQRQVYEYYFMRFIYNTQNLFFSNYDAMLEELGGYAQQFTPAVYDSWLADFTLNRHQAIQAALRRFIASGDFRMDYTHFGNEFSIDSMGAQA